MLAFLSEEEIKKIIPPRLPSLTPHTIVLRTELMKQLEEVRKTGLGYDNEEYNEGIRCIGSPVFDVEGRVVAGLGVSGLVSTFRNNRQATFEQLVLECAYRVSKDIGYSGDYFADKLAHPITNQLRRAAVLDGTPCRRRIVAPPYRRIIAPRYPGLIHYQARIGYAPCSFSVRSIAM